MEAPQTTNPPTFESVWVDLQETKGIVKEITLQMKETDRRMKETDRIVKRNARQMGHLHNRFGELAEHLVAPSIARKFNEMGFHFDNVAPGGERIFDGDKVLAQVDIVLRNSDYIVAIEVKAKPDPEDIPEHINRLEILRAYWTNKGDKRKLCGAIAGAIFPENVKKAALKAGLYVLVQSGDTMKIETQDGFIAREW
jgi:hypothetical protein